MRNSIATQLLHSIESARTENLKLQGKIAKEDVESMLIKGIKKGIEFAPIPENTSVELLEIKNMDFKVGFVQFVASFNVNSNKASLAEANIVDIDIMLKYSWNESHLLIDDLVLDTHVGTSELEHEILDNLSDVFLFIKEKSYLDKLKSQANAFFQNPNNSIPSLIKFLPKLKELDYHVEDYVLSMVDEDLFLKANLSIYMNQPRLKDTDVVMQLDLSQEQFDPLLEELVSTMKPTIKDVELNFSKIDLIGANELGIDGTIKYNALSFDYSTVIKFSVDAQNQVFVLDVADIMPKGGFLVRKSFSLIEGLVKREIESRSKIPVSKILSFFPITLPEFGLSQQYLLDVKDLVIQSINVQPANMLVHHEIRFKDLLVELITADEILKNHGDTPRVDSSLQ